MADVKFACPGCQLHIKVGVEYVGMASTCPECQQQFRIPAPPGEVKFACGGCQLRLALHESYIGSQIACPGCNAQVIVPNPAAPAPAVPALAPATPAVPVKPAVVPAKPKAVSVADRVGAPPSVRPAATAAPPAGTGPTTRPPNVGAPPNLGAPPSVPASLVSPVAAAAPPATAATAACPGCGVAMPADAIICTSCGYNTETGEEMASAVVEAKPPPPPGGRRKAPGTKAAASEGGQQAKSIKLVFWILNGISLLLFAATFVAPAALAVMNVYAILLGGVAYIWGLVAAGKETVGQLLLSLFVPFYQIYFVFWVNWNPMLKRVYGASLIGSLLYGISFGVFVAKLVKEGLTQGVQ